MRAFLELVPAAQLRFLGALVASVFFGVGYDIMFAATGSRRRNSKYAYLLAVSHLLLLLAYDAATVANVYFPVVFTYVAVVFARKWRWMPEAVLVGLLAHLSAAHLLRYNAPRNTGGTDATCVFMVMVMRLSALAFDAQGRGPPGRAFTTLGPVEFLAWALYFPGLLVGPAVNLADFRALVSGSARAAAAKNGALQFRARRVFRLLGTSAAALAVHAIARETLPLSWMLSDAFFSWNFVLKIVYLHVAMFGERCKYYFAWCTAEAAAVASGLGHSTEHPAAWDAAANVDPFGFETVTDFRSLIAKWNVGTNRWLHAYVYTQAHRVLDRRSPLPSLLTYLVSAFWHGFHPAYYATFVCGAWMTAVSRMLYRRCAWPFGATSRAIFGNVATFLIATYILAPFSLLDASAVITVYRAFYYWGHIALFLATILLTFVPHLPSKIAVVSASESAGAALKTK